jgi:hypothetical protein
MAVEEQTLAMLMQRRTALTYYIRTSYSVTGIGYTPPVDVTERIAALEAELTSKRQEVAAAEAAVGGGLLGVMQAVNVATQETLVSQLEYQLASLRYGFPVFVAPSSTNSAGPSAHPATPVKSTKEPGPAPVAAPSPEEIQKASLRDSLAVRLVRKRLVPADYKSGRYEDWLGFAFEYENKTEKDVRAFTGTVVFKDIFDRPFYRLRLTVDEPLSASKTVVDTDKGIDVNKFDDDQRRLVNTEIANLKVDFEPASVLFVDGTRIGDPE